MEAEWNAVGHEIGVIRGGGARIEGDIPPIPIVFSCLSSYSQYSDSGMVSDSLVPTCSSIMKVSLENSIFITRLSRHSLVVSPAQFLVAITYFQIS